MSPITLEPTPIPGLSIIKRQRHSDGRGFLERIFEKKTLSDILGLSPIVQVNHSFTSSRGTIRGMHCQLPPDADSKVVTCTRGSVFDVVVDLRAASKTFGHWWGYELSEANGDSLLIPEGCAHGLQTLEDSVDLIYLHTGDYSPEMEAGINPLDPTLEIAWPLATDQMSDRDRSETRNIEWFKGVQW